MQKKLKFMNKRVLAFLLAITMVVTTIYTDGLTAFANSGASGDAIQAVVDTDDDALVNADTLSTDTEISGGGVRRY